MKIALFIYFLFISILGFSQTEVYHHVNYRGDTTKLITYTDPTVCQCVNISYQNKSQKKYCDKKFDYDFMSDRDKREFNIKQDICRNPSICDCALADMKDPVFLKRCDQEYLSSWISKEEKKRTLEKMRACTVADLTLSLKKSEIENDISICDCINIDQSNYLLKGKCNTKFFNEENLTEEEIETNNKLMLKCVQDNKIKLDPTICECASIGKDDEQYIKACSEKFNLTKMDSLEINDYHLALASCDELNFYKRIFVINDSIKQANPISDEESNSNQYSRSSQLNKLNHELEDALISLDAVTEVVSDYNYNPKVIIGELNQSVTSQFWKYAKVSVCDCKDLKSNDYLMTQCIETYRLDALTQSELNWYHKIKEKCAPTPTFNDLCDCYHNDWNYATQEQKENCNTLMKELSPMEKLKYRDKEKGCE